ncbi:MAG: hypothetical protein HYV36_03300, partial [Lentisphaerae bacterium]|nr:hypothetical protein [Lentisphaerota bacterium]
VTTVYLLNTDLDNTHTAALWVGGRQVANILVPPADVRPVFLSRGLVIVPADKFIDLKRWSCPDGRHVIKCTSLNTQTVSLYALTQRALRVMVNGKTVWCAPGVDSRVTLRRRVDPVARAFFAPDFMAEPRIRWQGGDCPY